MLGIVGIVTIFFETVRCAKLFEPVCFILFGVKWRGDKSLCLGDNEIWSRLPESHSLTSPARQKHLSLQSQSLASG